MSAYGDERIILATTRFAGDGKGEQIARVLLAGHAKHPKGRKECRNRKPGCTLMTLIAMLILATGMLSACYPLGW